MPKNYEKLEELHSLGPAIYRQRGLYIPYCEFFTHYYLELIKSVNFIPYYEVFR